MIELPAIWPDEQTTLAKSLIMVRSFRVLRNTVNKLVSLTLMRALLFGAIRIDMQRMIANRETQPRCHFFLACLDGRIVKLLDVAALQTNDVIVVIPLVQLENRLAAFEMVFHQQPGLFELGEHPVHRGQAHVFSAAQQLLVNVFRAQMSILAVFEQIQHLEPRQGGFETGTLEMFWLMHIDTSQLFESIMPETCCKYK
jgi:hypothetical protein